MTYLNQFELSDDHPAKAGVKLEQEDELMIKEVNYFMNT